MRAAIGKDLQVVLEEARDLARQRGSSRVLTSHALLALALGDSAVNRMLAERRIDPGKLAQAMRVADDELDHLADLVCEKACAIAGSLGATEASSVHYLLAITAERRSAAFMMLEKSGANPAAMRAQTYSLLTGQPPIARRPRPATATSPGSHSSAGPVNGHGRAASGRRRSPVPALPRSPEALIPQPARTASPPPPPRSPIIPRKVVKTPVRVPPPQPIARPSEPLARPLEPETPSSQGTTRQVAKAADA
ncbi:MAG: hypothetical protein IT379_17560, partial [Deltaproteobacteria bacterium]|nr:hypothetical protein [Deltaproteobacteria bacterium]